MRNKNSRPLNLCRYACIVAGFLLCIVTAAEANSKGMATSLSSFPSKSFDRVRLTFAETMKLLSTQSIRSGPFAGMISKVYGFPNSPLPRFTVMLKAGRVYALEQKMDIQNDEDWKDFNTPPLPSGPVSPMSLTNEVYVKALSGFNAAEEMDDFALTAFKAFARSARGEVQSGRKVHYTCGPVSILATGNLDVITVMYVPKSTWEVLRLKDLDSTP